MRKIKGMRTKLKKAHMVTIRKLARGGAKSAMIDTPLSHIKIGVPAVIERLDFSRRDKRRILDLGFTIGSFVLPVLESPARDPRAYQIRGAVIALRNQDAAHIFVRQETEDAD